MNKFFGEIQGKLGFGLMRLPMAGEEVDMREMCDMVDMFIGAGLNYFDTAHGYLGGRSERAFRDAVSARYPREKFLITNKLSEGFFDSEADIRPFFESQLKICNVEYFDFYLLHAQNAVNYKKYRRCNAYETALRLRDEGKVRHVGLSFHDHADVLEGILNDYPELEVVQLQFNYLDYDDPEVESGKCYSVCIKHNKPVIVMEPVKGGTLALLPPVARAHYDALGVTPASVALRYAAGFDRNAIVLSGMSNCAQMRENIALMSNVSQLTEAEKRAADKVKAIMRNRDVIRCTGCRYCVDGCPKSIAIPDVFAVNNAKVLGLDGADRTIIGGKPEDCVRCGRCESACPQHLKIRELLARVAAKK